jgi:murein DD-endopeptidase MepM/ murein hydrolase activator NlpD
VDSTGRPGNVTPPIARPSGTVLRRLGVLVGCALTLDPRAALPQPAEMAITPPVSPACISSPFGPRSLPNRPLAGKFHNGIDLPAAVGAPVKAVAPGSVIRVQRHGVGGLEMLIQHQGFIGVYSHLGLIAPVIAEGRRTVSEGEKIATVGRSGLTYGAHLYFGMIVDGLAVDPSRYLNIAACGSGPQRASERHLSTPVHILVAKSDPAQ